MRRMGRGRSRRGSVLLVVALFLPVMMAFAVATVDVGHLASSRARLQAVADMAVVSALGNVSWNGRTAAEEETEIRERVNQVLRANGLPVDFFGTPVVTVVGDDVTAVRLRRSVPVETFFWGFVVPGVTTIDVEVAAAAAVTYSGGEGSSGRTRLGSFGIFGVESVRMTGSCAVATYEADSSSAVPSGSGNGSKWTPSVPLGRATSIGSQGDVLITGNVNKTVGAQVYAGGYADIRRSDKLVDDDGECVYESWSSEVEGLSFPIPATPEEFPTNPAVLDTNNRSWPVSSDEKLEPKGAPSKKVRLLQGATYTFAGMDLTNGTLELVGSSTEPTTIYVTEDVKLSGQITYNGGKLRIIGVGQGGSITWTGQARTYADIYAPGWEFTATGNGQFFGRVVAGTVDCPGNADLYCDTTLDDFTLPRVEGGGAAVTVPVHLTAD